MERLTNRKYGENSCAGVTIPYSTYCIGCITSGCNCGIVEDMVKKLADYENLEEQGRLIKLPCKVGDTVYVIVGKKISAQKIQRATIDSEMKIEFCTKRRGFALFDVGKTVFLTKSEAEAKLKELRGGEDDR